MSKIFTVPVNLFVDAESPAEAYALVHDLLSRTGWESHDEIFDDDGNVFCTQDLSDLFYSRKDTDENSENTV